MKTKTKSTYIEVNGKRYDAVTGKLLGSPAATVVAPTVSHSSGVTMDGVKPKHSGTREHHAAHKVKKPQKSQTLMRGAVKKPQTTKRAPLSHEITRAKSPLISKFGNSLQPVTPRVEPVMVAHAREDVALVHSAAPIEKISRTQVNKADDMISKALERSESHNEPRHKVVKKRSKVGNKLGISRKAARMSSAFVAVLLLGAFFAYQNIPNFAMRVAATRAGFDARMPGYHPSGFAYQGPVEYRSGEVTVKFGSNNADNREFSLVQRASNWNNDALLANFVLSNDSQYQTFQDSNKTIYIYDRSNATWVNNGVWYQLEGNAELTTDQISRLANSL